MTAITLRSRLKSRLWEMMSILGEEPDPRPMRLSVRGKSIQVTVSIGPPGAGVNGELPGSFLSPLESAIWAALADGPLNGKRLASRTGQKDTPTFRTILGNLRARGVLTHTTEHGYARARK